MIIDYVISIPLNEISGKSKATLEKIDALIRSDNEVRVFYLKPTSSKSAKLLSMLILEINYFIKTSLSKNKPDLVFTRSYFCFGTWLVERLYSAKVIREVHANFYDEAKILFEDQPIKLAFSKLYEAYINYFINSSSGVIFNNPLLEGYYKRHILKSTVKTTSIYNGANTDLFKPRPIDEARNALDYKFEAKKKHLLFLGSVSKWHGVEHLLNTFRELEQERDDVVLLIVGGGNQDYLTKLENNYCDLKNIVFIGPVPTDKAERYINSADACVLPSANNRVSPGSPLKLYDYAACGKPIISQENLPGYSDVIETHDLGTTVDYMNPKSAAKKISTYIDTYDCNRILKHNRDVTLTKLSWDIVIKHWLEFSQGKLSTSP